LFGLSDQLKRLPECGNWLDDEPAVDFEMFRPALDEALAYGGGSEGGRWPSDMVAMFKVLILAAQNRVATWWSS
jgi:hypothetical protein